jgi:hypothetical protein
MYALHVFQAKKNTESLQTQLEEKRGSISVSIQLAAKETKKSQIPSEN